MESAELYSLLTALTQQVSHLSQAVLDLQQHYAGFKETVRQVPAPPCFEPDVSLPAKFSGNRSTLATFKLDCELVFSLKPYTFATDFTKVRTVLTLLSGHLKTWAHQLLSMNSPVLNTWDSFIQALGSILSQPRLPSATRHFCKPRRLSDDDYSSLLQNSASSSGMASTPVSEEPMEIGATVTRLSSKEMASRRSEGRCFYCGLRGHFIPSCPTRPPRPPVVCMGNVIVRSVSPTSCAATKVPVSDMLSVGSVSSAVMPEPVETTPVAAKDALPPDCTYASDGTVVCKQDLEVFELALKAVNTVSKAKSSRNPATSVLVPCGSSAALPDAGSGESGSEVDSPAVEPSDAVDYLVTEEPPVPARRVPLRRGYCQGSSRAWQTARRGRSPGGPGWA